MTGTAAAPERAAAATSPQRAEAPARADVPPRADVVVVGAGHNGLVASALLARAGLDVVLLERAGVVGGACRTEHPFPAAPGLAASTGAYLLGLVPPELLALLDVDLPLVRRDPHYFLPLPDGRSLLLGGDPAANAAQVEEVFGAEEARADAALSALLDALRADLAPAWLAEPGGVEETADRYLRPGLEDVFVDLVRGSAVDFLRGAGLTSDVLTAMYAVTDGMPGLSGSPFDPGSGHNLLVHSMCRLPGAGGTWMVVRGGMGTVTSRLRDVAQAAGAVVVTDAEVARVTRTAGANVDGVVLADGREVASAVVVAATDPFRLDALVDGGLPPELAQRVEAWRARPGWTLKVNLALQGLPTFSALPEHRGQHGTTVHLLPDPDPSDGSVLTAVDRVCRDAAAGRLPEAPPLEWYLHSTLDPSLQDEAGRHSSALFVQGVPHTPAGSSWEAEEAGYVQRLLAVVDRYAPGTSERVVDVAALSPPGIERHFGITGGNIFHVDNVVALDQRMPYVTGVPGLYAGGAGCHPAGSVIGCAGHNAAQRVLADLGLPPARRQPAAGPAAG